MSEPIFSESQPLADRDDYIPSLLAAAREARAAAYCPYSNFPVGAALLASNGTVYRGCNVENASFGLTMCAERNAIAAAVADGQLSFLAIAISTTAQEIARPCGACRQVIAEFSQAARPIMVVCESGAGASVVESIDRLLPATFNLL